MSLRLTTRPSDSAHQASHWPRTTTRVRTMSPVSRSTKVMIPQLPPSALAAPTAVAGRGRRRRRLRRRVSSLDAPRQVQATRSCGILLHPRCPQAATVLASATVLRLATCCARALRPEPLAALRKHPMRQGKMRLAGSCPSRPARRRWGRRESWAQALARVVASTLATMALLPHTEDTT